jgi:hypothetical protein
LPSWAFHQPLSSSLSITATHSPVFSVIKLALSSPEAGLKL